MGLLALAFSNLDTFTRFQVMSSDRRAQLQHTLAYTLEHMVKEIGKAIGSVVLDSPKPVVLANIGGDSSIKIWIDFNQNGQRDAADWQIAYRYTGTIGVPNRRYEIWYCPQCVNNSCADCIPQWPVGLPTSDNIIGKKITAFTPTYNPSDPDSNSYLDVTLTACWDPTEAAFSCGTPDNPTVTMRNCIDLRSVSIH